MACGWVSRRLNKRRAERGLNIAKTSTIRDVGISFLWVDQRDSFLEKSTDMFWKLKMKNALR